MSWSGRINVDALVHDEEGNTLRVLDVESSDTVTTKTALVTGTATLGGVIVDPAATGYYDASSTEVSFASVDSLVLHGTAALACEAGDVTLKTAAGQCGVTATPGHTTGNITISGSGTFSLLIVGE